MPTTIKTFIKESRDQEIETTINNTIEDLAQEGLSVEFGKIGNRTTYALIHDESHDIEILGYTFIKDMKYYKENLGKLKALQQAMARKELTDSSRS